MTGTAFFLGVFFFAFGTVIFTFAAADPVMPVASSDTWRSAIRARADSARSVTVWLSLRPPAMDALVHERPEAMACPPPALTTRRELGTASTVVASSIAASPVLEVVTTTVTE